MNEQSSNESSWIRVLVVEDDPGIQVSLKQLIERTPGLDLVRVFRDGQITEAFKVLHGLLERMAIYPILCEHHYSEIELDATWENIPLAASGIKDDYELPDDWADHVYEWLSDNRSNALENVSDQGGWPDEDDFRAAFDALGYPQVETAC